jgi:putative sigma-54 modulation protein
MKVKVSFNGLESSDALTHYLEEKISKHEKLLSDATSIEAVFRQHIHARGVKNDFRVDINVNLPSATIRVEETGESMYKAIDTASDTLFRRLKRYHDRYRQWSGEQPWRVLGEQEAEALLGRSEDLPDNYEGYLTRISVRKKLENMRPLEEGEAIEKMELMGYQQLLFKNKATGKISMLYKRDSGDYGLVEPNAEL